MNPLRQRYIDDLRLRNFSPGTIKVYVHAVERFVRFLGRSPVDATGEDLRRYLVAEINRGVSRSYCVILRNAVRHLFEQTLGRPEEIKAVPRSKHERRLPGVVTSSPCFTLVVVRSSPGFYQVTRSTASSPPP